MLEVIINEPITDSEHQLDMSRIPVVKLSRIRDLHGAYGLKKLGSGKFVDIEPPLQSAETVTTDVEGKPKTNHQGAKL